ncbi:cobalamin biosynthesis protein CobU [Anoxybacillus gonensis]|uniref:Adenosylcobinamide kinase n=1 Tax=Anoxybacillus gonensis TaxID=198467 RepID=A0AAW7THT5_9BACL|nr:bifunctional adenosylcobinamide kinase/adenosylcobinamide-phosphate guanylyltransferase [Anoxybacillus gonensis]AKS38731.1 cobalamin biosynthesis protein CobU [Anoxybacillus gonensis]KGP60158.1 cobalamin biosynthesis protein CobU [Anoxybacillus gonensis]MCX8046014.1 bifunctional adenosylcobinamide kinase/adenosylcobinamide-phosphate guanylyltransferase [Anoxybacillus gonensis]MDO0876335.1 bifunctional adenosylcobinamide kinase/adenosylcobinamide-phosphate guanylyltransferase [Anoxybacillus g
MIVFISGGVRSGKSSFAEQCAKMMAETTHSLHYIATAIRTDEEMEARIAHHQKQRKRDRWQTWEQPYDLDRIIYMFCKRDIVLLDCLTNLWANELFRDHIWDVHGKVPRIVQQIKQLSDKAKGLIIVSNEVFYDGVPNERGTYMYMHGLGLLHQHLVTLSDVAILMRYGLPIVKKGRWPCGVV